jgi:hypothetical protein
MSIMNRPSDGLLSALLALWRAVRAYGPGAEENLLRLVVPATVVTGRQDLAAKTLTRWKQLGFFVERDGHIHLSEEIATIDPDDLDGCRAAVLRLVLLPSNNPEFEADSDAALEKSKASDCTRAMAWALAQDPYSFPSKYKDGAETLQYDQGVSPRPFTNDTRWAGFLEWATFLGAGFRTARVGFVPVPWFAVKTTLAIVFGEARVLAQADFFERLAECLPIVDGGSFRLQIAGQTSRPWRAESGTEVSPSLSAALLTLEASGVLRLEERSDAPQRILLGAGGRLLHRVSHIERLEGVRD